MPDVELPTWKSPRVPMAEAVHGYLLDIYAVGEVERAQDQVKNVAEMLGQLVEKLYGAGRLTDTDITDMMPGHTVVR